MKVRSYNVNYYPDYVLNKIFTDIFKRAGVSKGTLLEIGCGNSVLLPYFSKEFGFQITGIDYSEIGCETSRQILARDKVEGQILLADAFHPPPHLLQKFDVVCSFGVVEHFNDTSEVLKKFSLFLKPGGILITTVPNFKSATGLLHKWLNKPVYDIHVPLDKDDLVNANQKAGLQPLYSSYFLAISFAITLEGVDGKPIPFQKLKKIFIRTIRYFSKVIWMLERVIKPIPARRLLSGGVITASRKSHQ